MSVSLKIDAHNGVMEFSGPLELLPAASQAFLQVCPWARKVTPTERWQTEADERAAVEREKRHKRMHRSLRGVFNLYGKAYARVAAKALNENDPPEDQS